MALRAAPGRSNAPRYVKGFTVEVDEIQSSRRPAFLFLYKYNKQTQKFEQWGHMDRDSYRQVTYLANGQREQGGPGSLPLRPEDADTDWPMRTGEDLDDFLYPHEQELEDRRSALADVFTLGGTGDDDEDEYWNQYVMRLHPHISQDIISAATIAQKKWYANAIPAGVTIYHTQDRGDDLVRGDNQNSGHLGIKARRLMVRFDWAVDAFGRATGNPYRDDELSIGVQAGLSTTGSSYDVAMDIAYNVVKPLESVVDSVQGNVQGTTQGTIMQNVDIAFGLATYLQVTTDDQPNHPQPGPLAGGEYLHTRGDHHLKPYFSVELRHTLGTHTDLMMGVEFPLLEWDPQGRFGLRHTF